MHIFTTVALAGSTSALDDGLATSPPMGWRSWNQFGLFINQSLVEAQFEALVDRSRNVDGVPTSLTDLGYKHAAIDDGWQLCNSGPNGHGFHNASGYPNFDKSLFPDVAGMTAKARSLGLKAGWYENNCHCSDHSWGTYEGLVNATLDLGFEGIKMDRAGLMNDAVKLSSMFNATGRRILQENNDAKAHRDTDGNVVCPMHLFRTGLDIRPTHGSMLKGMESVRKYNENGLTGPGCWAHADMLAVGVTVPQPPGAKHHCATETNPCFMTVTEMRSNFGGWCIISNPLVLAMDLRDSVTLDSVWPIITNREAIAINQQWFGDSGRLHSQSSNLVVVSNCGSGSPCNQAQWMVWSKVLPPADGQTGSRVALFLLNNDNKTINVSASLAGVHGLGPCGASGCSIRSVWEHVDLPPSADVGAELAPHDSSLLVVASSSSAPGPAPTPAPVPSPPPSPLGPCVQPNVLYDSHKDGNTLLDGKFRAVADSTACQELCYETDGCVCFSHRKSLGHCWLMTACQHAEDNDLYDSGTAVCAVTSSMLI